MRLNSISLQSFRLFKNKTFDFNNDLTLIVGPNAIGKTSIVEAINLLSTGSSFRANKVEEMIGFEAELARVKGVILEGVKRPIESGGKTTGSYRPAKAGLQDDNTSLEILLTRGEVQGRRTQSTLYSVNDVRRRKKDFVGKLLSVVFRPEDMRLVEGSPARRRQFIDNALCLVDSEYAGSLKIYLEALKKRNKLLWQIKEGEMSVSVLSYWNQQLLKYGEILQQKRREFFNNFSLQNFPIDFTIEYQPSVISLERQKLYQSRAIAAGHSLIGPHKDDFVVNFQFPNFKEQMDVAIFGSRGQQRLAVLWLKFCELEFVSYKMNERPVLLLDDILSELDETSQSYVLDIINRQQTIITSADSQTESTIQTKFDGLKIIFIS